MPVRNLSTYLFALFFVAATLVGCGGGSNPITISGTLPSTGTVNTPYSGSLTAAGGNGDFTWSVTGLPAGVTASNLTSASVTIAGTPTAAGTASVTANVRDTKGRTASYSTTVTISGPTVTITGTLAATGTVGAAYNGTLAASGGTAPYTWTVTGLPSGVTYSGASTPTLAFSGTPTAAGTSTVTVTVADSSSPANTGTYNVTIIVSAAAGIAITGSVPATGTVGTAYTGTLTATGGTAPYTWSVTNVPDGVAVSDPSQPSITISGTPTTAKTYAFVAKVTDSLGANTSYGNHIAVSGTVTTACVANPTARGNEASFNKPYAFILSGLNDGGPSVFAGSITPDGTGAITAGAIDSVQTGTYGEYTVNSTGSTYSFGSDGRGCVSLSISQVELVGKKTPIHNAIPKGAKAIRNTKFANATKSKKHSFAAQQAGTPFTVVFSISVSAPYQVGRMEEFDFDTYSIVAAGQMHQQNPSYWDLSSVGADFVLGVSGYAADGEGGNLRAAMAANILNTSGTTTSPSADVNIGGAPSGLLSGGTGTLGAVDFNTGRGTGTYTAPYLGGTLTFDFAYYVINGGDFYAVTTDNYGDTGTLAMTGRALAATTDTPALNGYYMIATTGLDPNAPGNTASIGTFQAPSASNIANATLYSNDAGTFAMNTYASATYTLTASTGRAAVAGLSGNPPVAYLTATVAEDDIAGFIVGTGPDASAGFILLQSSATPAFSAASISGGFTFGTADDVGGFNGSEVGQFNFASGNYSAVADLVLPFVDGQDPLQPDQPASGAYTVNADGSGAFTEASVDFVTNGSVILGIDTGDIQDPFLYILVSQAPIPD